MIESDPQRARLGSLPYEEFGDLVLLPGEPRIHGEMAAENLFECGRFEQAGVRRAEAAVKRLGPQAFLARGPASVPFRLWVRRERSQRSLTLASASACQSPWLRLKY